MLDKTCRFVNKCDPAFIMFKRFRFNKEEEQRMSKFSVRKPYTVLVGVIMVIVLGIVSFTKMSADLLPSINLPYVIVMTTYVGASPETVEMVVTKPVESAMATVSNIENISSTSSENYSMVIMEFSQNANMDSVSLEIRENLDQIASYWDDSVGSPIIMKVNPDMLPVMIAAVGMEGMNNAEISEYTQQNVIPRLESIEGVASASATGLIDENVHVVIRQEKIDAINEQVFGSIDKGLEEAQQEINDGYTEISDGEKEISDSLLEIAENQQDLNDAKQEIEDGKKEIANKKSELASGKEELKNQKEALTQQMAEGTAALIDGKAKLEANIASLQAQQRSIFMTDDLYKQTLSTYKMYNRCQELIDKTSYTPEEITEINGLLESMTGTPGTFDATMDEEMLNTAIDVALEQVKAGIENGLAQNGTTIEEIAAAITGYEKLGASIKELQSQTSELDNKMAELTAGQITAASEFGSADATIAFGEVQLESAEKQLEASEEQLTSGQEQIDAAYEQIDSAKEQLSDAREQLADAQKQLDDSRDMAYSNADMNGILTVETVKSLLTAQNFSMPAGYVTEEGTEYLIRVGDKPDDVEKLKAMPLLNMNMDGVDIITLGDVADVFMTDNSAEVYTNVNGTPGVMLQMQKQTGYSTGDVSDKILDEFKLMLEEEEDLILITLMDQGIYIDFVMDSIMSNILAGGLLAVIILIFFLKDLRPTFVIAISIPISLISAIVCMYFSGVTLNIISLSGLALGVGMLVDNSIVVIENIYRLRNEGASMKEAAIEGSKEVAGAIVASTLTTVCVFAPIVFTEGITRQLFVDMGLTIAYSLLASLVVALTVVPAMASKILKKVKEKKETELFERLSRLYEKSIAFALKWKVVVLLGVVVLLVASAVLAVSRGIAFMPSMDSTQITVTVEAPIDSKLEETAVISDDIVSRIREIEDVQDVGAMMGGSDMSSLLGTGSTSTNVVTVYVTLYEDKTHSAKEVGKMIEEATADIENVTLTINTEAMDLSVLSGSGISIQVRGRDLDTLQTIATEIAAIVERVEGTAEVSDGMEETTSELRILVDRDKAIECGLTVAQVFQQINAKITEDTGSTQLVTDTKEYDILVIHQANSDMGRNDIKNLQIDYTDKDDKKCKIALSEIAVFEEHKGLSSINRDSQSRYIAVSAAIAEGYNVGIVADEVNKALEHYELPSGYSLVFAGENEMIIEAMEAMILMLVLAIIFMFLIMVAQFQSLLSPFIIMFTVPLAFTGGLLGLYITKSEVSVIALIGFVMLAGIIVNNGIVLVDYINQLREGGMEKKEAIMTAGRTRLRPVLMTALTTILAMSTMLFSTDMGADMSKPMSIVIVGGLTYGTLLTLYVVPCIYDVFNPEKKK